MKIQKHRSTKWAINLKIAVIFLLIIITSPWFFVFAKNYQKLDSTLHLMDYQNQTLEYEINTARGVFNNRLVINKFQFYVLEAAERYFEAFDPKFLFFTGDLNILKSIKNNGVFLFPLLPFILFGLYQASKSGNKIIFYGLAISALPSIFVMEHYETISKIPAIFIISYIGSYGLIKLYEYKKTLTFVILTLYLLEFLRFLHDFLIHYPFRLPQ